jgi:putative transposase
MLALSGRVTMLGLSRWADKGGSYRTVQRFYNTVLPWPLLFWWFFRTQLYQAGDVYLLVGDECVVPKAGKQTHGLDRFFSSLYGKPIPGVAFFTLGLVNTRERRAYPLQVEQLRARESCKGTPAKPAATASRPVGRPKGSQNRDKTQVTLTPELELIQNMVRKQGLLINGVLALTYLVLDGQFGNHNALEMTRQCGLHLISKLRGDAALYLPYTGSYAGRGPHRKYGARLDYAHLPRAARKASVIDDDIQSDTYQLQVWHASFAAPLNVVILVKTNLKTGAQAHVILFSSDLTLSYEKLVDYYSLRFQIEFNFRDAKQYWGLDDFMNVKPTPVTNAANLALFMVNVAHRLLLDLHVQQPHASVLDLKALFRGHKYVTETLKFLPERPDPVLLARIYARITALGCIHQPEPVLESP